MSHDNGLYILTGATGSIGKELAKYFASQGHALVLACRNTSRADELRSELRAMPGCGDVTTGRLSLDSLDSIHDFANYIKALGKPVSALINNAGVMCRHRSVTTDGFEQTIAVNYLAPVLLTRLLLPLMGRGSRIVFTTSITRKLHSLRENILDEPADRFSQLGTYGRTKLVLTHYAQQLSEELSATGILVNCADPGVVDTNMITMDRWFDPLANVIARPFMSTPAVGASSAIAATLADRGGMIFKHRHRPAPIAGDLRRSDATLRPAIIARTHAMLHIPE